MASNGLPRRHTWFYDLGFSAVSDDVRHIFETLDPEFTMFGVNKQLDI